MIHTLLGGSGIWDWNFFFAGQIRSKPQLLGELAVPAFKHGQTSNALREQELFF